MQQNRGLKKFWKENLARVCVFVCVCVCVCVSGFNLFRISKEVYGSYKMIILAKRSSEKHLQFRGTSYPILWSYG